jgi:cysteine-S-conjugate beta-lyase
MNTYFDQTKNRYHTSSVKWDLADQLFGIKNILPMWVADMDFEVAAPIKKALIDRAQHGIFGYTFCDDSLL